MRKISVLLLIFLCTGVITAQTYSLTYNFDKGKTYLYRESSVNDITQQMMGNEMKVQSSTKTVIRVSAEEKTPDGTFLVLSLDSAFVETKMPMRDTAFSIDEMLNKKMRILLSGKGDIVKRESIDSVDLSGQFAQLGKREPIQFFKLPAAEIKTGENWSATNVDTVELMGGYTVMTTEMKFNMAGSEEKMGFTVLKIPFTAELKIEGKGTMMGMEFFLEGTGKSSGDFYFNEKDGIPVHTELSQEIEVTMAATGDQNMIIPITQNVKTTRTLIK